MSKIKVSYDGNLRTTAEHILSENTLFTDAAPDNHGKGEAFSPSDLIAAATLTSMITTMAIVAGEQDIDMGELTGEVEKLMVTAPRRIARLQVALNFIHHNLSESDKNLLENAALNCPITRSLHPDIIVNLKFHYD